MNELKSVNSNHTATREELIDIANMVMQNGEITDKAVWGLCVIYEIKLNERVYVITYLADELKIVELKQVYCFEL